MTGNKMENFTNYSCYKVITNISTSQMALYVTVGCLESVLIIITNLLTIAIIVKFKSLRNTSNFLIANLAVSDLLVGVLIVPRNVLSVALPQIDSNKYGCLIKYFNWMFIIGSAILNMAILSIDRLFAIMTPMKYVTANKQPIVVLTCAIAWFMWALPCVLAFCVFETWQCWKPCTVKDVVPPEAFHFFAIIGGLALLICFGLFVVIVFKLKFLKNNPNLLQRVNDARRKSGMIVLVFGVFVIFLIPMIVAGVYVSSVSMIHNRLLVEWTILIAGVNSFANSLIYGWKRPEFRKAYFRILTCARVNRRIEPVVNVINRGRLASNRQQNQIKDETIGQNINQNCPTISKNFGYNRQQQDTQKLRPPSIKSIGHQSTLTHC